jgi:hypothetical protein
MILAQEVGEDQPSDFNTLPAEVQSALKDRFCLNCAEKLSSKIHYILLRDGDVRWWHEMCVAKRFR